MKKINMNSLIIYSGLLLVLVAGIQSKNFGGIGGILAGMIIIYFLLADEKSKENIRNNLMFKRG